MKKKLVHVSFDGGPAFNLYLELDDVTACQDFHVFLAAILKRGLIEGKVVPGIRWDPDALAEERRCLRQMFSTLGQPIVQPKKRRRARR